MLIFSSMDCSWAVYTSDHAGINKGVHANVHAYPDRLVTGTFFLLLMVYGLIAVPAGLSADSDSALLMRAAEHWVSTGEYVRSRTSGFPLYEALLAACKLMGASLLLINGLSLCMAAGVALIAYRLAGRDHIWRGHLALALLLTYPLFMIASAEPMETMLSVLLAFALVARTFSCSQLGWSHAGLAVLLVLTRLDAALLVMALALASTGNRSVVERYQSLLWLFKVGCIALLGYVIMNQGFDFLNTKTMGFDAWWRRLARALASSVNALQLTGLMALVLWFLHIRRLRANAQSLPFLDRLLLWSMGLYGLRFLALPDEIFYLIIPILLLLLRVSMLMRPSAPLIAVFLLTGCLQSFATLSLFERLPGTEDRIAFRSAASAGPLLQELRARKVFTQLREDSKRRQIECALFPDCPALSISHSAPYLYSADRQRAAVSARYLYVFFSGRYPRLIDQGFREIRVCDEEVVPGPAWRIWQPSIQRYLVDVIAAQQVPKCRTLLLSGHQVGRKAFN
ncbi:MAG: hypothetical protein V4624_03985 [Pseudomonadota bacterium]